MRGREIRPLKLPVLLVFLASLWLLVQAGTSVARTTTPSDHGAVSQVVAAGLTFGQELVVEFLRSPTAMEFTPDGRLFVAEQGGHLRVVEDGMLLEEPFLSVPAAEHPEGGLIGVTLDPEFESNGFVYVYYTYAIGDKAKANRVSRFRASEADPNVADADSEETILDGIPGANVHNGGGLHFGPDGKLYVGTGAPGVDDETAQDLGTLGGKLLRINADGTIPADNPFVGQEGIRPELYAYGLRNVFSFAIDPETGRILINDVGDDMFEEVNLGSAGANYGWPLCEGFCETDLDAGLTQPLYAYPHGVGSAIAGGVFVRGSQLGDAWQGSYLFADFLQDFVRALDPETGRACDLMVDRGGVVKPVDLDIGPDGHLYYLRNVPGRVYRLISEDDALETGPAFLLGDLNCSNEVDSLDSLLVLQAEAGYISFLICQCADVNSDSFVNSIDASLILQHDAGLFDIAGSSASPSASMTRTCA